MQLELPDGTKRQLGQRLGRQRADRVERERFGVGSVEELEARPFQPGQLGKPGTILGQRMMRQVRRQPRADLAQ